MGGGIFLTAPWSRKLTQRLRVNQNCWDVRGFALVLCAPDGFFLVLMVVVGIFAHTLTSIEKNGTLPQNPVDIFTVHYRFSVVFIDPLIWTFKWSCEMVRVITPSFHDWECCSETLSNACGIAVCNVSQFSCLLLPLMFTVGYFIVMTLEGLFSHV